MEVNFLQGIVQHAKKKKTPKAVVTAQIWPVPGFV